MFHEANSLIKLYSHEKEFIIHITTPCDHCGMQ